MLIDFIKGSGIVETAVPYIVNNSLSRRIILAHGIGAHRKNSTPSCTCLMLLSEAIVPAIDLARPATVARQRGSTNFTACVVPQIIPVDMEAAVVPPVNHLVR